MPHIHTRDGQHDFTASAFVVRTDLPGGPKIMLHLHKKLKKYMQFGGHVELDENSWQAVVHEIAEESGYDIADLKILQPKDRLRKMTASLLHPQPMYLSTHDFPGIDFIHWHIDTGFAFVASGPPRNAIAEGESAQIKTFNRSELNALPLDDIYENVREASLYVLDVCLKTWEPVDTKEFDLNNLKV